VLDLRVCAADRVVGVIYANAGQLHVAVPEGLDGKMWFVRPDVGSASRMATTGDSPRYLDIDMTLELRGVPGYLAPTWEQWFDPRRPCMPLERGVVCVGDE
jgi:hypothetical protein